MKRKITWVLVLAMLLGVLGVSVFAEEPETLTVETRTSTYTFCVGDTFTYSYWLRLAPDVLNYADDYAAALFGEDSEMLGFADRVINSMKLKIVAGSVMFDTDCLSLQKAEMPALSLGMCLEKPQISGITDFITDFIKGDLAFLDHTVLLDEQTSFREPNVLIRCTFRVEKGCDIPVYLRTRISDLVVTAIDPFKKDTEKDYSFIDKRQTVYPYESYETVNDEEPRYVLKSMVDDAGFDLRCTPDLVLTGKEKYLRPGADVKVTMMGMTLDGRWVNFEKYTSANSVVWFYDIPYGQYYVICSYTDKDGDYFATADPEKGEHVNVPATGELQALWLLKTEPNEIKPVNVTMRWVGDNGYLPARPAYIYAVLLKNGLPGAIDDQRAIDRETEHVCFENAPLHDKDGEDINYELVIRAEDLSSIPYEFAVEKTVREDGGADFTVTAAYTGDPAALGAIPADENGHYWVHQAAMDTEPSCDKGGRSYYICEVCHQTRYDTTPALGHCFCEWTTTVEPQEYVCGERERTCLTCGYVETESIPAFHEHQYIVSVVAPTCMTAGYTLHTCACGDTYQSEYALPLGHNLIFTEEVAPTCTEEGSTVGVYCSRCARTLLAPQPIPALGHDFGDWMETLAPTETECGEKERTCAVCSFTETMPVAELNHTEHDYEFSVVTLAPTCTEGGCTLHTCYCGETYTDGELPPTGHTVVTDPGIEPTYSLPGLSEGEHCAVCHTILKRQEILPVLSSYPIVLNLSGIESEDAYAYADGVPCTRYGNFVYLTTTDAKTLVLYTHNSYNSEEHATYPTHMYVWKLRFEKGEYTATRLEAFDDILQYAGSSIRITGNQGIRMITAVPTAVKEALAWGGLMGCSLEEYGTIVAWDSELASEELTLEHPAAKRAYAYKANEADPIYKEENGLTQYTNVLVGFTEEKCVPDLSMRSYMILKDIDTEKQIVLYGGTVHRSIGYIAYQNKDAFPAGSAEYEYIQKLLSGCT